jgi:hypothetical protein
MKRDRLAPAGTGLKFDIPPSPLRLSAPAPADAVGTVIAAIPEPSTASAAATATAAPPKPAPKGLGLGLGGSDLPGRRTRKPGGSAATTAAQPPSSQDVDSTCQSGGGERADGSAKPARKLPAEAQRLADDLMSLLQEAGLGG